jgi:hypothetical protein
VHALTRQPFYQRALDRAEKQRKRLGGADSGSDLTLRLIQMLRL